MSRTVDPEILLGFLEEAGGYLPAVRAGIAALNSPDAADALAEAHRGVHTIKGAAAMVGLAGLSHIAEQLEARFDEYRQGTPVGPGDAAILEQGVAAIDEYLRGAAEGTLDEGTLVSDAVDPLRELRGLPAPPSAATGAALGGGPDWVAPFPPVGPANIDDTIPEIGDLAPPPAEVPAELLEIFRLEADDHLRALTTLLPGTKANPADKDQWQEIRRAAHTLKGTAAMVGFADVTKLAHRMEDLLDQYSEGTRVATADEIDLLVRGSDAIDDAIQGRPVDYAAMFARLDAALNPSPAAAPESARAPETDPVPPVEPKADRRADAGTTAADATVRMPIERLDEIVKLVGELVIARSAFEARLGDFRKLLDELDPSSTRLRRASTRLETGFEALALGSETTAHGFDALELDRYTEFHLVSRELAETTGDVQAIAGELGHIHSDCDGFLTRQARLASELEDKLMRLRMVPLGTAASRLQRTVRQAADQTRKKAELVIDGDRTGLDKTVLEAMADPLLHLLRNAVDHGLEAPDVRRAIGKPEAGTIRLSAAHEGSQVVLRIADDGRGIDPAAVRDAARARGLAFDPAADPFDLLFEPGFSTRSEVSELSGRGVGLDVVKSRVAALKGTVAIESRLGHGTIFTIRLPLTLAITRALLVSANGQTFALPLDSVERILRFEEADVQRIGGEPVLAIGDDTVPVAHLGRVLELKTPADPGATRPPVVVVNAGGRRQALVVDRLLGGREIVVKTLGPHLRNVPSVSGATLLGDGSVVLILNPSELLRSAAQRAAATMSQLVPRPAAAPVRAATSVLIVDDSPSVRRVLTALAGRQGWTATVAKDGVEALDLLRRGPLPDVVLSDVEMPRMDGYELLGSIRGQAATATLPVVMITSRAAEKHRKKAMDLGASAYVTKPYRDDALADVIRHLTNVTRRARSLT